ncbi:MAG: histidine kinase [Clostridia bacterium]|nr:histidine kinase [Clostridia bacterium]
MERYRRQQRERDELQMAAMLSQIQPHFLFNALAAIYDIARDSAETRQAISEFSEYLRVNIDSLKRKAPVPFETEKKHVETYLKLERLSMEDHLRWRFDCEAEAFLLPALTVQPLVENAVKHGVSKRREGGTVVISTRSDADRWIVSVIDDGVGFDPAALQDDGKTHVGIENVRERLRMMCGDKLTVSSVPGVGTESVITIPRRRST